MVSKRISQRDARGYRKRVKELQEKLDAFGRYWATVNPGVLIDVVRVTNTEVNIIRTARLCGRAVVVKPSDTEDKLFIFAANL